MTHVYRETGGQYHRVMQDGRPVRAKMGRGVVALRFSSFAAAQAASDALNTGATAGEALAIGRGVERSAQ